MMTHRHIERSRNEGRLSQIVIWALIGAVTVGLLLRMALGVIHREEAYTDLQVARKIVTTSSLASIQQVQAIFKGFY
ncbi:MAG: hypothetical protein GXY52_10860 [Chloroflexi bacterium]|nr:hypothetical protein [Chloroflexota bacterium]